MCIRQLLKKTLEPWRLRHKSSVVWFPLAFSEIYCKSFYVVWNMCVPNDVHYITPKRHHPQINGHFSCRTCSGSPTCVTSWHVAFILHSRFLGNSFTLSIYFLLSLHTLQSKGAIHKVILVATWKGSIILILKSLIQLPVIIIDSSITQREE